MAAILLPKPSCPMPVKSRAPRNRTLSLTNDDRARLRARLRRLDGPAREADILDATIHQDAREALGHLPDAFADLLILDPPYNIGKQFGEERFSACGLDDYEAWLGEWLGAMVRLLRPAASIYICADWRGSAAVHRAAEKFFRVRNRITWEREKGRGAAANWKNCSEDIWFCTVGDEYCFNVEAVKLRRRVIAPYTRPDGQPKDWQRTQDGDFRMTHPSNLWTDITVPFWSMPENTDHPTQKPEKLIAKLILANSRPGDVVFDPFLGSGTTSVVAKKLGRRYVGIERQEEFALLAERRLELAEQDAAIQGWCDGVFLERNTMKV